MDNQHQKITGYRDLTATEIELMNKIKAKGVELEALLQEVTTHLVCQSNLAQQMEKATEHQRMEHATPYRWVSIARTDLQTGLMALTRAVAQPSSF